MYWCNIRQATIYPRYVIIYRTISNTGGGRRKWQSEGKGGRDWCSRRWNNSRGRIEAWPRPRTAASKSTLPQLGRREASGWRCKSHPGEKEVVPLSLGVSVYTALLVVKSRLQVRSITVLFKMWIFHYVQHEHGCTSEGCWENVQYCSLLSVYVCHEFH